jgi:hypothetical protein
MSKDGFDAMGEHFGMTTPSAALGQKTAEPAKATDTPAPAPTPEPGATVEATGAKETATGTATETVAHKYEPPASWTKEEKAAFYDYDESIQERMSRDYKNMQGDYTKKTQEISPFRNVFDEVNKNGRYKDGKEFSEAVKQMFLINDHIVSHPELAEAFKNMIQSHVESKSTGKPWEFGSKKQAANPEMEKLLTDFDGWLGKSDEDLETDFVNNTAKNLKQLSALLKHALSAPNGIEERINAAIQAKFAQYDSVFEPFRIEREEAAKTKAMINSLPEERKSDPEFIGKVHEAWMAKRDGDWKDKPLEEQFSLAAVEAEGYFKAEKARKEGEEAAKLEADKQRLEGVGRGSSTPGADNSLSKALMNRYEKDGIGGKLV